MLQEFKYSEVAIGMKLDIVKDEAGCQRHLTVMEHLLEIFYKSSLNWNMDFQ